MLRKKQVFPILLISLLMAFAGPVPAAAGDEIGVSSSASELSFSLRPGASAENSFYITNGGSTDAEFSIYIGEQDYEDWFTIIPASLELGAGEAQEISVKLELPSSVSSDVDCLIKVLPESGTVRTGIKIHVNIDVLNSESDSSESGTSGSGSSGGGGGSPEPQSNVENKELAQSFIGNGARVSFEFTQGATAIGYIEFDSQKTIGKTTTIIEELKEKSTLTPTEPEGEVYKHLNIWVGNGGVVSSDSIENAVVGFKVSRAWIEENGIDSESVCLVHFNGEEWETLETAKVREAGDFIYFEASVSGFSPFAITGKKLEKVLVPQESQEEVSSTASDKVKTPSAGNETESSNGLPGFEIIPLAVGFAFSAALLRKRS